MLIPVATLERIAAGEVTLAFRRWRKPTVKAGGTLRTAVGVLSIDAVDPCPVDKITEAEARAAGHDTREALLAELLRRDGDIYRIALSPAGADPRVALRENGALSPAEAASIAARLDGYDRRSPTGPWTRGVLALIGSNEGLAAAELAARLGVEKLALKANVRKLKELGLTESLDTGYRLSPRGRAFLAMPE